MTDLYKIIDELLQERGISGAKMSSDLGMSRSFMTELRKGRAKSIKTETARKIADYFGVSTDYLLGNVSDPFFHLDNERILAEINDDGKEKTPTVSGERDILDEIDIAFYGEYRELTEDDKETVRDMVRVMRERRAKKQEQ